VLKGGGKGVDLDLGGAVAHKFIHLARSGATFIDNLATSASSCGSQGAESVLLSEEVPQAGIVVWIGEQLSGIGARFLLFNILNGIEGVQVQKS